MGGSRSSSDHSTREEGRVTLTLLRAYSVLQTKYGWTVEYIKGKWRKICLYSNEPCNWGSCLERNSCKNFDLELFGLTRPLFLAYVKIASRDDYEREKRLYNVLGMLITGKAVIQDDFEESNYSKNKKVNIEAKKKDILYDFPYDISYPTEKMITDNIKYWKSYEGEPTIEIWDKQRAEAARGNMGIIARRCAVNDLLWQEYLNDSFPDQKSLKNRVKLDHIRLALYPSGFPTTKICVDFPPIEHWVKLRESKELHRYIRELTEAGFPNLEEVLPVSEELEKIANEVREELKKEQV